MTYHDLTKAFVYSLDDAIYVRQSDIESLSKEDWNKKFVEVESIIAEKKSQATLSFTTSPTSRTPTKEAAETPVPETKTPDPLPAPIEVKEDTKEDVFTASFEVQGTMAQLKALGAYMKENNINYKNI